MPSFWQRNKRRALALVAAGAAGVTAAYFAYQWWSSEDDNTGSNPNLDQKGAEDEDKPSSSGLNHSITRTAKPGTRDQPSLLVNPTGDLTTAHMDAEAHLQHHFESIQEIADATTLPSLLPTLGRTLVAAAEVDFALDKLRRNKEGSLPLPTAEKVALWEGLKVSAMSELLASCWALPLLDLLVKIQLNVLGRHLYLETALDAKRRPGSPSPARLSAPSQEQFLSYAEHLAKEGHMLVLESTKQAAATVLGPLSLDTVVDEELVCRILSECMAVLEPQRWADCLLPSPEEVRDSLVVKRPDDRAMYPAAEVLLVDGAAVEGLMQEVARIVSSERFHDVAVACAKETASDVAAQLTHQLHSTSSSKGLPLARIIPMLSAQARRLLQPRGEHITRLADMEVVKKLCALVYSCGPPL